MQIQDSVVLVTGGAKRLGNAMVHALAERGARVVFTYRQSAKEAQATVRELQALGATALAVRADLGRADDIRRLIERIEKTFGRLDVLINSASNFFRVPFDRLTEADWDRAMNVNAKGAFLCALYASRLMRKTGRGKIINFADWSAHRPHPHYLPYCVSKAAVIGLTKALAKELAPKIQVVAIAPGPMLPPENMSDAERKKIAELVPLKRWGAPEDIMNTVLFLIEGTDFMTGSVVYVDGGRLIS